MKRRVWPPGRKTGRAGYPNMPHEAADLDEDLMGLPIRQDDFDCRAHAHDVPTVDGASISIGAEAASVHLCEKIAKALTGPAGLHGPTLAAAIGALAGHTARWMTHRAVAAKIGATPFTQPCGTNHPFVSVSETAECHVVSLTEPSFASALVSRLVAAGVGWMPQADRTLAHNFRGVYDAGLPDYSVPPQHWPQCSVHSILMMLWEPVRRDLATSETNDRTIMQAFGLAAARAALDHAESAPPAVAAQLALETSIATSRLEYAF